MKRVMKPKFSLGLGPSDDRFVARNFSPVLSKNSLFPSFFATSFLDGRLFLGSEEDAKNAPALITRILNLAEECHPIEKENLKTMWIKWRDHSDQPICDDLCRALVFIHQSISDGQPILVHCKKGVSRSATVVIAYIMCYHYYLLEKMSDVNSRETHTNSELMFRRAFDYVKSKRIEVSPNIGFCLELVSFSNFMLYFSMIFYFLIFVKK
jgi:predicted protein tyrosine phosphatase